MKLLVLFPEAVITLSPLTDRMSEGGSFMYLILICLLLSLFFIVKGFLSLKSNMLNSKRMLNLAVDTSLLGLAIGFFSSVIGLITAFDSIEAMGNADPSIFAGGLKVSLLTATFGLLTFIIARIGIVILRGLQKD
ncbi:MotA/TolQ/ExbB proton channel family protein [Formosa maritima]|uniref:MotA/TolQ/ExbB proton channel family protein n=1 Tax=Formosa maritima TaxID=2592046 RepID=A0A5D0GJZ5_9FLAO|nr:MotA/TolQ/ExbB proton channel family protein [Formosa maritima]TYA59294.1 MotA/TolQ/ExbB proton channel family protein [Formosa maritima]